MNRLARPLSLSPERKGKIRWLLTLSMLLIAMLCGVMVSFGVPLLSFVLIGGIIAAFMLLLSPYHMLYVLAFSVTLVIGQLMYFAGINQALWLPYGLGLLLFFRLPGVYEAWLRASQAGVVPFIGWFYLFMLAIVLSVVINLPNPLQVVVGSKNLIALWSVYLIIALGAVAIERVEKLFSWLFPLALLQLPFVLYQYFIVAAGRSNRGGKAGISWDAIVGSFGGDPSGGGASSVMAFYLVAAVLFSFALYRKGVTSWRHLLTMLLITLISIGLAEVKIVVILLPIGVLLIMLPELLKRPFMAISTLVIVFAMMIGVLYLYDSLHYAEVGHQSTSFGDLMDKSFGYSLDPNYLNPETGEISRVGALILWWNDGMVADPIRGLFGYGPGASRAISSVAVGEVAARYSFFIGRSAACQLFWDVGLLGFLTFTGVMLSAAITAYRLAKKKRISDTTVALLQTCSALLVADIIFLPYSRDLLEHPAQGFLAMIILGYVALAYQKYREVE